MFVVTIVSKKQVTAFIVYIVVARVWYVENINFPQQSDINSSAITNATGVEVLFPQQDAANID